MHYSQFVLPSLTYFFVPNHIYHLQHLLFFFNKDIQCTLHINIQKVLKGLEVIIIIKNKYIFFKKKIKTHLFLYPLYMLHKSAPSEYKSTY